MIEWTTGDGWVLLLAIIAALVVTAVVAFDEGRRRGEQDAAKAHTEAQDAREADDDGIDFRFQISATPATRKIKHDD